mgnify:CR=1 FL=1
MHNLPSSPGTTGSDRPTNTHAHPDPRPRSMTDTPAPRDPPPQSSSSPRSARVGNDRRDDTDRKLCFDVRRGVRRPNENEEPAEVRLETEAVRRGVRGVRGVRGTRRMVGSAPWTGVSSNNPMEAAEGTRRAASGWWWWWWRAVPRGGLVPAAAASGAETSNRLDPDADADPDTKPGPNPPVLILDGEPNPWVNATGADTAEPAVEPGGDGDGMATVKPAPRVRARLLVERRCPCWWCRRPLTPPFCLGVRGTDPGVDGTAKPSSSSSGSSKSLSRDRDTARSGGGAPGPVPEPGRRGASPQNEALESDGDVDWCERAERAERVDRTDRCDCTDAFRMRERERKLPRGVRAAGPLASTGTARATATHNTTHHTQTSRRRQPHTSDETLRTPQFDHATCRMRTRPTRPHPHTPTRPRAHAPTRPHPTRPRPHTPHTTCIDTY